MRKPQPRKLRLESNLTSDSYEFQISLSNKQGFEKRGKPRRNSSNGKHNSIFGGKNVAAFFPFLFLTLWLTSCNHPGVNSLPVQKHATQYFKSEVPGFDNEMEGITKRSYRKDKPKPEIGFNIFKTIGKSTDYAIVNFKTVK